MNPVNDGTISAIEFALRGVTRRADAHAQNISNTNTPGYTADIVEFEHILADALDKNTPNEVHTIAQTGPVEVRGSHARRNQHGNNVDLNAEMTGILKNNLTQEALVSSYQFKLRNIRTALGR